MKNLFKKLFLALIVVCSTFVIASCGQPNSNEGVGVYTYNTYTTISPSNWNELTYQDNNDTQIMSYISGSFFTYDFKFDENGEIISGEFVTKYSAATALEDVSHLYDGAEAGWGIPEGAINRAYKITLRDDLKWEDGTAITANDFVYTMQEQLDPLAKHYRADSYYVGSTVIHNAENYVKQGVSTVVPAKKLFPVWEEVKNSEEIFFDLTVGAFGEYVAANYGSYIDANGVEWTFAALTGANEALLKEMAGKSAKEILADESYAEQFAILMKFWQTDPNEELDVFGANYTYPATSWEQVGLFKGENDLEIVVILDAPLKLINEDGSLNYECAYSFSGLPLVHKATWEANKVAPSGANTLWTSTYCQDTASTMSWGPYKLLSFQNDKQYVLVRNDKWYGYNMEENEGLYQVDRIVCETIGEWGTAWLKFLAGEIDGIGIDVSIADEYKGSARAYFTPDDFVGSLQLQSIKEALAEREEPGINKTILAQEDFRKALSLGIDRTDYNRVCTTSSLAGYGLFNSMHYYDVENGGVFRNTDEARKVLCNVYNVDWTSYPGATDSEKLEAAEKAITGVDIEAARALIDSAVEKSMAAGDYKEGDTVKLTIGTGAITESTQRMFDYLEKTYTELCVGTKLEGKIAFEFKDFGSKWANDFRAGAYDICTGGWSGAAWDPGYFLLAYLADGYRYARGWDPTAVQMEFTMVGVGEDGSDVTDTMNLLEWYNCLNGVSGAKYNWSSTRLPQSLRLQLIAALEEQILKTYYCIPIQNYYSASLLSFKMEYITYEYNTFMAYGGIKYATFSYDDYEWDQYVKSQGGELNYK